MPSKLQCIVASCTTRGVFKADRSNITLYKFPDDEQLLRRWKAQIYPHREEINISASETANSFSWVVKGSDRVCSLHFRGGRKLGKNNVPTIFDNNNDTPRERLPIIERDEDDLLVVETQMKSTQKQQSLPIQTNEEDLFVVKTFAKPAEEQSLPIQTNEEDLFVVKTFTKSAEEQGLPIQIAGNQLLADETPRLGNEARNQPKNQKMSFYCLTSLWMKTTTNIQKYASRQNVNIQIWTSNKL
eukprot:Seg12123.1 transcript_id=Seg12123.1/GoldUCD/mRNA.D3Y31 product="hypothetical protein" protein_id=Seg12123.1/GoldUCD/D3Y31